MMLRDGVFYIYGVLSTKPLSLNLKVRLYTDLFDSGHLSWLRKQWTRIVLGKLVKRLLVLVVHTCYSLSLERHTTVLF